MKVVNGLESLDPPLDGCVLTIGNFDGVHLAHRQLLAQASSFAADTGGPVAVLTFEPHPLTVVAPDRAPPRLATADEKLTLLEQAGADITVVAHSDARLLALEAERFVEEVIHKLFHPTHVVEGPSFGFGKGRRGTPALLKEMAPRFNFDVHIVEPVKVAIDTGEPTMVSSSLIRRLIGDGRVQQAAHCLGRPYALRGTVVEGDRRGRTIGFPTANLRSDDQLIPGEGVYAGAATVGDSHYDAAISIGSTPTFDGKETRVEAYLLNFEGDLYGQTLRLEFLSLIRPQMRFDSAEALTEQLHRDVQAVRSGQASQTESTSRSCPK